MTPPSRLPAPPGPARPSAAASVGAALPSLERVTAERLLAVLIGLAILHLGTAAFGVRALLDVATTLRAPLDATTWPVISTALLAFVTAVFFLTLRLMLPRLPVRYGEPLAALVGSLILLNCLAWFSVERGGEWLIPLILCLACSGFLLHSRRWLAVTALVGLAGYLMAGYVTGFHARWLLHLAFVLSAIGIAFTVQLLQRRQLRRLLAAGPALNSHILAFPGLSAEETHERFEVWFAATHEGVAIHDKGIIVKVNPVLARWLGGSPETLRGRNLLEWFNPASRQMVSDSILLGNYRPFEAVLRRADQTEVTVEMVSKTLPVEGRLMLITSLRDVTAIRTATQEAETERARLETAYRRQTALAEIGFGAEGPLDPKAMFVQVARAARTLLPAGGAACLMWEKERVTPAAVELGEELARAGFRPEIQMVKTLQKLRTDLQPLVVDSVQTHDPLDANHPRPVLGAYAAFPLADGPALLGALVVFEIRPRAFSAEDLDFLGSLARRTSVFTQRERLYTRLSETNRQLEHQVEQLQARQRELSQALAATERSSHSKDAFLATVTHELRNPLNAILGLITTLDHSPLDDEQRDCVETLHASAEQMLGSVNRILAFADLAAPGVATAASLIELRPLIHELVEQHRQRAAGKPIQFHELLTESLPARVRGNAEGLKQILGHLLDNAVRYTPSGDVAVGATRHTERDGRVYLRFTVSDTGPGIPPDRQAGLFQAFTRADDLATRRMAGLGLAICKRIVDAAGGDIGLESLPGQGSTFWFVLPFDRAS